MTNSLDLHNFYDFFNCVKNSIVCNANSKSICSFQFFYTLRFRIYCKAVYDANNFIIIRRCNLANSFIADFLITMVYMT